jgi:hypothetical protein
VNDLGRRTEGLDKILQILGTAQIFEINKKGLEVYFLSIKYYKPR